MALRLLVTGSSSGFGRVIVETLARRGYDLVASMRGLAGKNLRAAEELREKAALEGWSLHLVEIDVTDEGTIQTAVEEILREGKPLDVVVNNAGIGAIGLSETFSPVQMQRLFDVNVFGPHRVNRAFLPSMRERGSGLLIHISSGAGRLLFPAMGLYCASKFALEAYAETLRYELASTGVDSILLQPGAFATDFVKKSLPPEAPFLAEGYGASQTLPGQMTSLLASLHADPQAPPPQEVADAVLRLIETPAGQRPLRTLVPASDAALQEVNASIRKTQESILRLLGMQGLLQPRPSSASSSPS